MAEYIRKRRSKWDLKSESDINTKIEERNAQPGYAVNLQHGEPYADRGSLKHHILGLERSSAATQGPNLLKSEHDQSPASKWSLTEAINRDRSSDAFYENRNEKADSTGWGTGLDQSHSTNSFTHQDERQSLSHSGSPKAGRRRLYRSQSQNRSRSWSRSRSRSPRSFLDSRRETDGRNDRSRSEIERSELLCRDFVAGRCRKGGQCRFPHEDDGRSWRPSERNYHDAATEDIRENRYERGRSSGYDNCKHISGSMEQWDYSRDKLPYRQGSISDREKHDFHRSGKSTEHCMNFMRGRCQKGSGCRYVHHDPSRDGGTNRDNRAREQIFDRELDASSKHNQRQDNRRTYDNPCKFFAEGRCRNGDKCRFSHQAVVHDYHEVKHQNDKWDRNWGDEKSLSHDGPKSDHDIHVDQHRRSCWADGNRNVTDGGPYTMERQELASDRQYHQPHNLGDVKYETLSKEVSQVMLPVQEQNIVCETLNRPNECDSNYFLQLVDDNVHIKQYPGFEGERATCAGRIDTSKSQNSMNSHVTDQHILGSVPGPSFKEYDQRQDASHVSSGQNLDPSVLSQHVVFPATVIENSQQQLLYSSTPNLQRQSVVPLDMATQSSDSSDQIKPVPPPSHQMENKESSYSLSLNGENQIATFSSVPPLQNFNGSVQSHNFHFSSPRPNVMQPDIGELTKADAVGTKVPDTNSSLSIDNKTVTSEQIAQITNISASLAQLFGNGQQLPQLYAALNPPSSTGSLPTDMYLQHNSTKPLVAAPAPLAQQPFQQQFANSSTAVPPFQSNSRTWSEHLPQATEASLIGKKNSPQDTSTFAPTGGHAHIGDANRSTDLEEKLESATHEIKQVKMGNDNEVKDANGVSEDKIKKDKETEQLGEGERDSHADGQNKKSKDGKGVRMFKYALVELVKDILKPTWKEGTMSKEAHKTVVKKVVEKVTGTLQSNIPQTQEKIDHYLTYSKPKLGKLVQAYVDKYSKV